MKKILSLILVLATLCTLLSACAEQNEPQTDLPSSGETETFANDETKTKEDTGLKNRLKVDQVTSLPVANDNMTKAELRQLVLDYFELQLSFRWIPDMDMLDYPTTYSSKEKVIEKNTIYGGIPYQSTGVGNLYRWMEYYDEETGIFHMSKAFAENGGYGENAAITGEKKDEDGNVTYKKYRSLMTFFNQCSVASYWGWGRVINSANFVWTADMNVYNGFIPVGGYTYGYEHNGKTYGPAEIRRFGEKDTATTNNGNPKGYDTRHVISDWIAANGENAMYQCYAKMKPADCVVSGGHTMMVKSVDVIYRDDGTVNENLSSATMIEQIEGWGVQSLIDYNGQTVPFKNQGGVDRNYSFADLQSSRYIPFTFAEFLDPEIPEEKELLDDYFAYANVLNPIAKRYNTFHFTQEELEEITGVGVEKAVTYSTVDKEKKTITYDEFSAMSVASNYSISDMFVTVTAPNGDVLLQNIYRATSAQIREVSMKSVKSTWETDENGNTLTVCDGVEELATGENKLEISLQLSSGEKLVAYSGTLTK